MLVYILLAFVIGLLALTEDGRQTSHERKLFDVGLFFFLLVVGLRYMHGDYGTYQMGYDLDIDVGGDVGYFMIQKFIHGMGLSFQVFVFIITLFSVFAFRQVFRISMWPLFGLVMILGKIFTMYAMSGIRQYLAMALCWWAVSELLLHKRKVLFIAMVLVAFTLHASAIVFLPVIFFVNKDFNYIIGGLIVVISIVVGGLFMSVFSSFADMSDLVDVRFGNYVRDASEGSMNISNYIENFVFLTLALIARKAAVKKIPYYDFFLYMYLIYCGFLIAGNEVAVVKRLRDYYAISYAFIIPGIFFLSQQKKFTQFVFIAYFILLMFRSLIVFDSGYRGAGYNKMIPYHSILQME